MGQKVNPHGLRVGVIKDWDSRWFAKDNAFGDTLVEDYNIRKFLKKTLFEAGVPRIEIERDATKIRIHIHCSRPGIVIGKGGAEIEKLKAQVEKMVNKGKTEKLNVFINVVEVKQPDKNAQLVAENIAAQLVNRVSFRRAMKQAIGRAMKLGARGITTKEQFRCRPCVPISTTGLLRRTPPTARSASKSGSMQVRFCRKSRNLVRKEATNNASAQKS